MMAAKRGPKLARATRGDKGPCPAVCLATLKAIPYEAAKALLHREHGFTGNGLWRPQCVAMMRQHFGPCTVREPSGSNVATAVRVFFAGGKSGAVCDRGHIMPVVRGRLMNAHFKSHTIRQIETVIIIEDDSEVKARR